MCIVFDDLAIVFDCVVSMHVGDSCVLLFVILHWYVYVLLGVAAVDVGVVFVAVVCY